MKNMDKITLLGAILLVIAGIIIGQDFNLEVKLSDFLALLAVIVTFLFAYNGLKHNEEQYLNSIRPVIEKLSITDSKTKSAGLEIHNCGTGPALDIKYYVIYRGKRLSHKEFHPILNDFCIGARVDAQVGARNGMSPNTSMMIINFKALDQRGYQQIINFISGISVEISYKSVQGQEQVKVFKLVE